MHRLQKLLLLACLLPAFALQAQQPATGPDTVKVGLWLKSLYDMDLPGGAYNTNFWLWFVYSDDELTPGETAEVTNAKEFEFTQVSVDTIGRLKWASQECHAQMKQIWDVDYFPFDRQTLFIEIEDAQLDTDELVYKADTANSTYSREIELAGWRILDFHVETTEHHYATNFGDPTITGGGSDYPQFRASLTIRRKGWGLFFKLFTGVYVAFFISWLAFFLPPSQMDPRFGLSVGGLFGAVGNKYLVDSILPDIIANSLSDRIHDLTFVMLLVTVLATVIAYHSVLRGKEQEHKRYDRIAAYAVLGVYVVTNVYFIVQAAS